MRIVMLGPPGAGKGTQAKVLAKELGIPHISTGDIFRRAMRNETELGKKARLYIDAGNLVPDDLTNAIVRERLEADDCKKGFVLDGFPRTVPQAEKLDEMLEDLGMPLSIVVDIEVGAEEVIKRLENRRSCPKCGTVYHLIYKKPEEGNLCNNCKVELIQRDDDKREVIEHRIEVYHQKTDPLKEYYRKKGLMEKFNGEQEINEVLEDILGSLGK